MKRFFSTKVPCYLFKFKSYKRPNKCSLLHFNFYWDSFFIQCKTDENEQSYCSFQISVIFLIYLCIKCDKKSINFIYAFSLGKLYSHYRQSVSKILFSKYSGKFESYIETFNISTIVSANFFYCFSRKIFFASKLLIQKLKSKVLINLIWDNIIILSYLPLKFQN